MQQNGSQFVLMVIPNKNTLYDEAMPYCVKPGDTSNLERLTELLTERGVEFIDVKELFRMKRKCYISIEFSLDNKGAVFAYNALMEKLGREHETYLNVPYELEKSHVGDIDEMLYPFGFELEEEYVYDKEFSLTMSMK
ncbi:MAG: alginate O-acetyltransferase AlgX-related protein [Blautia sp.]